MLENLNEMQKQAVMHKDGPLLILAGAGSGKTKVLTTRIAYLISEGVPASNILAITFTNKAAGEMKERIEKLIGKSSITASTFHSFGVRILRENYEKLGYKNNFVIMDSDDSLTLIKKIIKDLGYDPKKFSPYMIKNKISSSKNEFIMPDEYKKFVHSEDDDIIYKVYKKYQEILYKNNSVDFDDLLILPIKLFKTYKEVLDYYQEKYKYILIDEYQDTNYAQYILIKLLSKKYKNLCVVGDNDQSIYMFRNADYRNILNFENDYKDAKVIMLEQNYRSTKTILNAANSVIKNNNFRKDKNLWCDNEEGDKISFYKAYDEIDEVFYIIRKIKELKKDGKDYKDMAILYRTNAQSRVFEQELLKQNIPFRIIGSFQFYSRKEIKDLLAYIRLIHNSNDDISLLRCINTPKRGIGNKTISELEQNATYYNTSMYEAIKDGKPLEFKRKIEELKEIQKDVSLTEFIDKVLDKTGMRKSLEEEKTLEADIRLENLEEFKSVTKSFEERVGIISLEEFLLEVSLVSDIEEYKDDPNRVTLMTVHSVKGLEYPYVFISGLEEGLFPHKNSYSKEELEEERRLMYVAITRAMKKLWITAAKKRMIYGQESPSILSRFVKEIDEDLIDYENREEKKIIKREEKVHQTDQTYNYGDKVEHDTYGTGVVIDVTKTILTIAFNKNIGIKKILKNHKSIRRIK
ncbi:MAG: UvrD-helicase domain-containing protein [bacterium]|nr:UvrD-helicase domain-containing protein [bacterium]